MRGTAHVIQVYIVCPAPLLLEAWTGLVAAQPQLSVAGTFAELPTSLDSSAAKPAAIFWAAAAQVRENPFIERDNLTRHVGILCLLDDYAQTTILRFLQAGFTGFITPQATVAELATALIATSRREIVLPAAIASQALAALARGMVEPGGQTDPAPDELTERELEVLNLLAQGLTNKAIAQTLFLSVRTIEAHLRSIYGKLAVTSRTEAALWAVRHGLSGA